MISSHETNCSKKMQHTLSPDNGLGEWRRAGDYVCLILWLMKGALIPTIILYLTERFILICLSFYPACILLSLITIQEPISYSGRQAEWASHLCQASLYLTHRGPQSLPTKSH